VHEAALVLGLDLGARFLRGAICDLRGEVRARQDIEMPGADVQASPPPRQSSGTASPPWPGCPPTRSTARRRRPRRGRVTEGRIELATNIPGLQGRVIGPELELSLGVPVTLENDVNLAAIGEQSRGVAQGVEDFVFLSSAPGSAPG
jgi:predicted NBD/HSP70 family sugar kinase